MNSPLLVRFLSGAIAGFAVLFVYLKFSNLGVATLLVVASFLLAREYARLLLKPLPPAMRWVFMLMCTGLTGLGLYDSHLSFILAPSTISAFLLSCIWVSSRAEMENSLSLSVFAYAMLGFFYCFILPATAASVLFLPQGGAWFLTLLLIVFSGDTFAYFFGRAFGKRPLAPLLSPKKTIEGSLGGLLGSLISAIVMSQVAFPNYPVFYFVALAIIGAMASQTGDLFESLVKRVANVKDSGRIMPGHGGAMDRLDGFLFASPFVYALGLWLAH